MRATQAPADLICCSWKNNYPLGVLQVLSDPDKRKVYDQFGEDGLKGGIPPGAANGGGMPGGFPAGGFQFRPGNAEDIFSQVSHCSLNEMSCGSL